MPVHESPSPSLVLPLSAADVTTAFEGAMTEPLLDHPEGLAFDSGGRLYCGGERAPAARHMTSGR